MAKPSRREDKVSDKLALFTDRDGPRAIFQKYLNAATEPPVLMFFGVGGAGKTWLLKKFREELPQGFPSALIDFDNQLGGQRFSHDPAQALYEIRQQLGQPTPRFDLAYAMRLFKQGASSEPDLKVYGAAATAIPIIAELILKPFPGSKVVIDALSKGTRKLIRGTPVEQFLACQLGSEFVLDLRRLTTQEIEQNLARYLAEDLGESLPPSFSNAVRAVLFFDTFEALEAGLSNTEHQRLRERWVQDLAGNLGFALVVIAGQNQLTWDEADPDWKNPDHLEQYPVGGLSEHDARLFLEKCGIANHDLQEAILSTASEDEDRGKHCFSLALCVDIVQAERRATGRDPASDSLRLRPKDWEDLARRFLKSLDSDAERRWIARLAITPRFDEQAARAAFSSERSAAQDAAWEALQDYSFVQPVEGVSGWYNIRSQMSWALENQPSGQNAVKSDHDFWRGHWNTRSQAAVDDCASLAWYHYFALQPAEALSQWNRLAEAARTAYPPRMREHFQLLKWWEGIALLDSPLNSIESATAAASLGSELLQCSLGDRAANLAQAIACNQAALRVYMEADFLQNWAMTQNNLGGAWSDLPTGDRAANLARAIACYQAALRVSTEADFPQSWAMTQNNLGIAWRDLPRGDRPANLAQAITCYQAALRVYTEADFPQSWATTQNNLGATWSDLPTGDRAANLAQAISCYQAALRVRTEADFPQDWAATQINLGNAWRNLPTGDRPANLAQAIAYYQAALGVYTEADFPQRWALTQNNLGIAWRELPTGDRAANLAQAIACHQAALRVYKESDFPQDWATTQSNLGNARRDLLTGERAANIAQAIACYQAALRVFTEADFPRAWAMTQNNLGAAWSDLPTEDRAANLAKAIACYQAALRVYTEADFPREHQLVANNLKLISGPSGGPPPAAS